MHSRPAVLILPQSRLPLDPIFFVYDNPMVSPSKPPSNCALAWERGFTARSGLSSAQPAGTRGYTVSTVAWQQCALSGCLWCRFLEKHFLQDLVHWPDWPFPRINVRVRAAESLYGESPQSIAVLLEYRQKASYKTFDLYASADDPAATYIEKRTRIPHVGAPHILNMAKTYIEECARDHEACRLVTLESTSLPSRLLDCSYPLRVRIVATNRHMRERYIALSYVWGGDQPHRTSTTNLASYIKDGIDLWTLPRTIQDAIHVTHTLGIRFLWVDSLCIIQDSQEDKHRELASMCNVYRCAYFTIDVSSASSASEGFLQDRRPLDPEAVLPFICPGDAPDETRLGNVYICRRSSEHTRGSRRDNFLLTQSQDTCTYSTTSRSSQTRRRGWCLQEALLSTRSLVFTSDTLQLRCQTITQNVGGAEHAVLLESELPRLPGFIFQPQVLSKVAGDLRRKEEIYREWREIVKDYSWRSLSEPSDKLMACAAIAEMFAPALGPDYVAGLWRNFLLNDLLWFRAYQPEPRRSARQRPEEYCCAPSWSWASAAFPIEFHRYELNKRRSSPRPLAEIVGCTVRRRHEQLHFGPVQAGGSVVIRANLLRCRYTTFTPYWQVAIYPDPDTWGPPVLNDPQVTWKRPKTTHTAYLRVEPDYEDDGDFDNLWIMPLVVSTVLYGLVVTRAESNIRRIAGIKYQKREVYRRVGVCWTKDPLAVTQFCEAASELERTLV
ncbi:heterokaryon incompatibility protein-domain-containing protein [Cubamyces lactineus]|nr:heterokaryon incompatibility protein-domain-containing protein [Cubamyces lactineus]